MPGISPNPCACCASAPSQPQSLLIRGVSPDPCGAQVAFRLCRGKVPRPRRSADADFLVKPSGDASAGRLRCICSAATSPSRTSATPAPLLSPPASACARRPFYMTTCAAATAACGPGAKVDLAYTTGPFPVPRCPAGASRTTGALILYGAVWAAVIGPPRAHR